MTDSTDNARGPERIWALPPKRDRQLIVAAIKQSAAVDGALLYVRADLAPDPRADPRVVALVEALEQIAGEAHVPVQTRKNGINFKKMYKGWRKIATTRIDIARAALAALSPTGGNADG